MSISHASKSRKHRRDADDLRRDVEAKALAQQVSPEGEVPSPPLAEPAEFLSPSSGQAADFSNDPPADDDADVIAINGGGEAKTGTVQVLTDEPSLPEADIHQQAAEAWSRLEGGHTFSDWLAVGRSLMADRTEAMREAHTNQPKGKGYCTAFGRLLVKRPFAKLEETTRKRLLDIMTNQAAVEAWLQEQTLGRRLELNHPGVVLRNWRASLKSADSTKPKPDSPIAKLRQENTALKQENVNLTREIVDLGGDLWQPEDKAKDIAKVMVAKLTTTKAKAVIAEMTKLLEAA